MNMISELFNYVGSMGPLILIILSMHLLWDKSTLFFYYIIGVFIDAILNLILKGLIQQPRPSEDHKTFNLALTHGKRFIFKNGLPHDIFGMPSGHTQSIIFSTVFMYLSLRKTNWLCVYLIISALTMMQRVVYNYHTIFQVFIGALVGTGFGYLIYFLARDKIKGRITEKRDDYGPT